MHMMLDKSSLRVPQSFLCMSASTQALVCHTYGGLPMFSLTHGFSNDSEW